VRAVSAVTSVMRAGATTSSSAATCSSAVLMPWPSSALPVKTVTCRRHRCGSSVEHRLLSRLPGSFAPSSPARVRAGSLLRQREAKSRPPAHRRRPQRAKCPVAGSRQYRAHASPGLARSASAARRTARRMRMCVPQRHRLMPCGADLGVVGRDSLQQRLRAHDHAGDAVAALRGLLVDEGRCSTPGLGGVPRPSTVRTGAVPTATPAAGRTAPPRLPDHHGAGAALAQAAAELGAVQLQVVAQHVQQRCIGSVSTCAVRR
jgi:hypothetical protein